jgi:hypothetical protein
MTECICASDAICFEQKREQVAANPKSVAAIWNGLQWLAETVGNSIVEVYRCNNDAQPKFSNGGTRVLIRPDRIDLA